MKGTEHGEAMNVNRSSREKSHLEEISPLSPLVEADQPRAWELLEAGRYMPRRIRGSFRGRELG